MTTLIEKYFYGDDDHDLMRLQARTSEANIRHWFVCARHHVFWRRKLNDLDITFLARLEKKERFDPIVLESPHAAIAAYYRYVTRNCELPALVTDLNAYERYREAAWRAFFLEEMNAIEPRQTIADLVVRAVMYEADFDVWYQASEELVARLKGRYGPDFCGARDTRYAQVRSFNIWRQKLAQLPEHELAPMIHRYMRAYLYALAAIDGDLPSQSHELIPITCNDCGPTPQRIRLEHFGSSCSEAFMGNVDFECVRCERAERLVSYMPPPGSSLMRSTQRPYCECGHNAFYPVICKPQLMTRPRERPLAGECANCRRQRILVMISPEFAYHHAAPASILAK